MYSEEGLLAVYGGFHSKEKASLSPQEEKQEKFCLPGNFEISLGKEAGERNSVLLSLSNLLGPRGGDSQDSNLTITRTQRPKTFQS